MFSEAFSAKYLSKALASPTNWTAKGAVTPVKNQGPHGYCGTFGRVASAEGQVRFCSHCMLSLPLVKLLTHFSLLFWRSSS